jgi:hypothetical protein
MPQMATIKIWPKRWQEDKFGIGTLPKQEVAQALFPT